MKKITQILWLYLIAVFLLLSCRTKNDDLQNDFNKNYVFKPLNGDPLSINLIKMGDQLTGVISNSKNGIEMQISGTMTDNSILLNEFDKKGNITGIYTGVISDSTIVGNWSKPDGSRKISFIWSEGIIKETLDDKSKTSNHDFSILIPEKFRGKYGVDCNAIRLNIGETNPIDITVNSNQVNILADLALAPNDNSLLLIYLDKPSDLGRGGMSLKWNEFSKEKPIGSIRLMPTTPKTLEIKWLGFYNKTLNKYDWTSSDFGDYMILQYCTDAPEQIKRHLLEAEWNEPKKFLSVSGIQHKVFNNFSVEIRVENSATLATFKDVQIKVDFLSKTNSLLLSKNYVQYDLFPPQKSKIFTWNLPDAPRGTQNIRISFINALPS